MGASRPGRRTARHTPSCLCLGKKRPRRRYNETDWLNQCRYTPVIVLALPRLLRFHLSPPHTIYPRNHSTFSVHRISLTSRNSAQDPSSHLCTLPRLRTACKCAKCTLSPVAHTTVEIELILGCVNVSASFTCAHFEEFRQDLFRSTLELQSSAATQSQQEHPNRLFLSGEICAFRRLRIAQRVHRLPLSRPASSLVSLALSMLPTSSLSLTLPSPYRLRVREAHPLLCLSNHHRDRLYS